MNAKTTLLFGSTLSALILTTSADKIRLEQAPRPVQQSILNLVGSAPVEDIDMQMRDGQTTYQVGFKKNGTHTEALFGPDGKLVNKDGSAILDSRKMAFKDLPQPIQQLVRSRTGRALIEDVDRTIKDGVPQYEVSFKQNGIQQELLVSHDGRILRDIQNTGAGGSPVTAGAPNALVNTHPAPVALSGAKKIDLTAAPKAVQATVAARASGVRLDDLEMGVFNGRPVYQAAFKDKGKHIELQVADDGRIIHDPRLSSTEAAGTAPVGVRGASSAGTKFVQPVALSGARKIKLNDAPLPIQNSIREQIGAGLVEDLEMGLWQGKSVYEAGFKWNGQHAELQLDENGKVLFDPRTVVNTK